MPFLTTSTGCPQTTVWACCIPLPTMEFAWLRADQRRLRRYPTFPTGAIPFGVFPSRSSGHHHRAIAGSFTECPSPPVVGLLSSCRPPKLSCVSKDAPTSGVSSPEVRCLPAALPRLVRPILPWASPRLWALTHRPCWQYEPAEAFRTLFESQPKPGPSRPQTHRSEPAIPTRPSPPNLLVATSTACAVVIATQGLGFVHAVSRVPPRCRSIALALQPSGAHRCRCTA